MNAEPDYLDKLTEVYEQAYKYSTDINPRKQALRAVVDRLREDGQLVDDSVDPPSFNAEALFNNAGPLVAGVVQITKLVQQTLKG